MTPSERAVFTHHPLDEILHSKHDIYKWDVSLSDIYERLQDTIVTTTTKEWEIVQVNLAEMRINNTQWGKGKYTWDIFPSTWTHNQIYLWYMKRDNTKGNWLPHWDTQPKTRNRKKFVTLPESFSTEL